MRTKIKREMDCLNCSFSTKLLACKVPTSVSPLGTSLCSILQSKGKRTLGLSARADGERSKDKEGEANRQEQIPASNPFVGGKISSKIAQRKANETALKEAVPPGFSSQSSSVQSVTLSSVADSPFTRTPKPPSSSSGIINVNSTERLKNSVPPPSSSSVEKESISAARKSVLEALRQAEQGGKTTKFGQPVVPSNIFDDKKRDLTGEEKFEFRVSGGQLFIVLSFVLIISIMLGTAYIVWKVGAIHYNEY